MKFKITESDIKSSKIPHEIFLTNLIVNHILYFISALGLSKSFPQLVAMVPVISICTLSYILIRGEKIQKSNNWFVSCHWKIAMIRSKILLTVILIVTTLLAVLYFIHLYSGIAFAQIIPFAGIMILPLMITILTLIVMESEDLIFSKTGQLSNNIIKKSPPPSNFIILEN